MMCDHPKVFIVDDDPAMRDSLEFMFTGTGLPVEIHASAESFLANFEPDAQGCLILDLRMPGMGGEDLHRQLRAREALLPVIILTGHGDLPTAVEEMKQGAFDFLSKPVHRDVLLRRVREAIAADARGRQAEQGLADIRRKLATLSARECQVMDLVASGQSNKQVAMVLGLSQRTVANHRARILQKMAAVNTADLVRRLGVIGRLTTPDADGP